MTAKEYWESFADEHDCWKDCQAYIICLGHNDLFLCGHPLGDNGDVHPETPRQNAPTYMGYYGYAKTVGFYIDYIIRHNMKDFAQVGLIGTGFLEEE